MRSAGVSRFEFYFDDTTDGKDAPEVNDSAASLLQQASEWCPGADVIVHRCTCEWWSTVQPTSLMWAQYGHFIATDVIARQVLALEVAARSCLAAGG